MPLLLLPRLIPTRLISIGCARAVYLLGALVWLLVCGDARAQAPVEKARIDAGRALYARYCQLCHAPDGTGYAAWVPAAT